MVKYHGKTKQSAPLSPWHNGVTLVDMDFLATGKGEPCGDECLCTAFFLLGGVELLAQRTRKPYSMRKSLPRRSV